MSNSWPTFNNYILICQFSDMTPTTFSYMKFFNIPEGTLGLERSIMIIIINIHYFIIKEIKLEQKLQKKIILKL